MGEPGPTNLATTLTNLDNSISSELDGNPPLWITRRRDTMHDDIYVNNAKVDISRSYQATNRNGKLQAQYYGCRHRLAGHQVTNGNNKQQESYRNVAAFQFQLLYYTNFFENKTVNFDLRPYKQYEQRNKYRK